MAVQVQEAQVKRARLAAEKAAADDKVAAVNARLPEIEAEKKAAAAKKVRATDCITGSLGNPGHSRSLALSVELPLVASA